MDFDFGAGFGLPFALSPFARLIATLAGSQYGAIDTDVVFGVNENFEIDIPIANTDVTTTQALFGYSTAGTTNYLQVGTTQFAFATDDGTVTWVHGNQHADGKIHTITAYRTGNTIGIKLDGVSQLTNTLGAASEVRINLVGCLGITTTPSQFFKGQTLEFKFTNITTGVVRDFVLDSGSTTEQYAKGSSTDKITLINFATSDWGRYTQQRNIAYDTGVIALGWVGENLVTNGTFDADSDWAKGDGWSISAGVAANDGSGASFSSLAQSIDTTEGSTYLNSFDLVSVFGHTTLAILNQLVTTAGVWYGTNHSTGRKITVEVATALPTNKRIATNSNSTGGSVDNLSVQHLLEVA